RNSGIGRTGGRLRAGSQGRGIDSRSGGLSHPSLSIGAEQLGIVPPQLYCNCFYFCVFGLVVGHGLLGRNGWINWVKEGWGAAGGKGSFHHKPRCVYCVFSVALFLVPSCAASCDRFGIGLV
ncbi:unnamed protein product, partial [Ectocarpus sp. 12 AP-2014]